MTGIIKVDTIQNNGGTTGLTIDSNGYITSGKVPAWRIGRDTDFNVTNSATWTQIEWDALDISAEKHFYAKRNVFIWQYYRSGCRYISD